MPIGVEAPHVGHRVAPGCRFSPQVEQRIWECVRLVYVRGSKIDFRPYDESREKIQNSKAPNPLRDADDTHAQTGLGRARPARLSPEPERRDAAGRRNHNVVPRRGRP